MNIGPLLGLAGVLLAVMAGDLNDQITSVALPDMRGALGIGFDQGTWIGSLYTSAQPLGMAISAWFMVTFSLRRWAVFVIVLVGVTSSLLPFCHDIGTFDALRIVQGLSGGLITPLLMDTALFVLPPPIRLYGLAAYALTATFVPSTSAAMAALWDDTLHWDFGFYQAIPLCSMGALLVWFGLPPDEQRLERFGNFDWRAVLLIVVGVGSLTTMLYQGDRLDWFNSNLICILSLVSLVALPLLVVNEWSHPVPFLKFQMLARRNFAYGVVGLFLFVIVSAASGPLPIQFLTEIDGLRPAQAYLVTFEIAAAQLVLLPLTALLLDHPRVDSRVVSVVGLALMATSCIGCSNADVFWNRHQFYVWQACQAVGQPLVVMPLLMMATNTVRSEAEAPFASALINFPRSIAEVLAAWIVDLVGRWRGALHSARITDQLGQERGRLKSVGLDHDAIVGVAGSAPTAVGMGRSFTSSGDAAAMAAAVHQQTAILTLADGFLVFGALTLLLIVVVVFLPIRTLPPRLEFAAR